jgi:hypothetical protein
MMMTHCPTDTTERAEATLAYRLMERLEDLGVLSAELVSQLSALAHRCELIVDAEAAWDDE